MCKYVRGERACVCVACVLSVRLILEHDVLTCANANSWTRSLHNARDIYAIVRILYVCIKEVSAAIDFPMRWLIGKNKVKLRNDFIKSYPNFSRLTITREFS